MQPSPVYLDQNEHLLELVLSMEHTVLLGWVCINSGSRQDLEKNAKFPYLVEIPF